MKDKNMELFLYGRLRNKSKAVAYCNLHKCYLEPIDIKEKNVIIKNVNIRRNYNGKR